MTAFYWNGVPMFPLARAVWLFSGGSSVAAASWVLSGLMDVVKHRQEHLIH